MFKILITSWITRTNPSNASASVTCAINSVVVDFDTWDEAVLAAERIKEHGKGTHSVIMLF